MQQRPADIGGRLSNALAARRRCRKAAEQARAHLQEMLQQELKQRRAAEVEVAAQRKRLAELEAAHIGAQAVLQKQVLRARAGKECRGAEVPACHSIA